MTENIFNVEVPQDEELDLTLEDIQNDVVEVDEEVEEVDSYDASIAGAAQLTIESAIAHIISAEEAPALEAERLETLFTREALSGEEIKLALRVIGDDEVSIYFTEEANTVGNWIKNLAKTMEAYARKFIAWVGKWIAKAGTLFGAWDKKRKELLEKIQKATPDTKLKLEQSLINKATSFFGAGKAPKEGGAILTFMVLRVIGGNILNNVTPVEGKQGINKLEQVCHTPSKLNKLFNKAEKQKGTVSIVVTGKRNGLVYVLGIVKNAKGTVIGSSYEVVKFKIDKVDINVEDTSFKDLQINIKDVENVLKEDGKTRRKAIDGIYTNLQKGLTNSIKTAKDLTDRDEAIATKQYGINFSKIMFKNMFAIQGTFRDAIQIASAL